MESEFIAWLREHLPPHPLLKLGIGDDAALLATAGRGDLVISTDLLADGVDFALANDNVRRIGHKALAVNLSDLAAMAAQPLAAVIALNLPHRNALEIAQQLYQGMLPLAEQFHLALAGGDTNTWPGQLVVSVTVLGEATADGILRRSGARPGDRIVVTGAFGGSILGRHLEVAPRIAEALLLNRRYQLHAGIDCSDGLSLDLWRICQASHCGATVKIDCIPIAPAAAELASPVSAGGTPLEHALTDGEDFELILAVPPDSAQRMLADQPLEGVLLSDIGEFVSDSGLWQRTQKGVIQPLAPQGFEHR